MILLFFFDAIPKSGKIFIFKLAYSKLDSGHRSRSQIIVSACSFDAGDKADIAFVITGRVIEECCKFFGFYQSFARIAALF